MEALIWYSHELYDTINGHNSSHLPVHVQSSSINPGDTTLKRCWNNANYDPGVEEGWAEPRTSRFGLSHSSHEMIPVKTFLSIQRSLKTESDWWKQSSIECLGNGMLDQMLTVEYDGENSAQADISLTKHFCRIRYSSIFFSIYPSQFILYVTPSCPPGKETDGRPH